MKPPVYPTWVNRLWDAAIHSMVWFRVIIETGWPAPYRLHVLVKINDDVIVDQTYGVTGLWLRRLVWEESPTIDQIHKEMFILADDECLRLRVAGAK